MSAAGSVAAGTVADDGLLETLGGARGRRPVTDLVQPGLVVVDIQRVFCDPASPALLPGWAACRSHLRHLVHGFREAGRPVVFTRHLHPDGDDGGVLGRFFPRLLRPGDPLAELDPDLEDLWSAGPVLDKSRHGIFSAPGLSAWLAGCDALVLAGVQTPLCITASALEAAHHGLVPVVSVDATAARTAQLHLAALRTLAAGHAHVASTAEILGAWGGRVAC